MFIGAECIFGQSTPGDFKIDYGFEYKDRARKDAGTGLSRSEVGPLSLTLAAPHNFKVLVANDTFLSSKADGVNRVTSGGDSIVGVNYTFASENTEGLRPQMAGDYRVTLPTANKTKGLGLGAVAHQLLFMVSKGNCSGCPNYFEIDVGDFITQAQPKVNHTGLVTVLYTRTLNDVYCTCGAF